MKNVATKHEIDGVSYQESRKRQANKKSTFFRLNADTGIDDMAKPDVPLNAFFSFFVFESFEFFTYFSL